MGAQGMTSPEHLCGAGVYIAIHMEFIETPPKLVDFKRDMNDHPMTAYRTRGDHVIEVEFHRASETHDDSENRGNIRIWKAQTANGKYVPGDGSKADYHWYIVASGWKSFDKYVSDSSNMMDHAEELAELLATSQFHFREFCAEHPGGIKEKRTDIPQRN